MQLKMILKLEMRLTREKNLDVVTLLRIAAGGLWNETRAGG